MKNLVLICAMALAAAGCAGNACGGRPPAADLPRGHALLNPDSPDLRQAPPDTFDVVMETTVGEVRIRVFRDWAPLGAYRFFNLVRAGFYDGSRFYRVLPGFVAQFGMNGRPQVDAVWLKQMIPDDPPRVQNRAGTVTFATAGPDTRSTQLFISFGENVALDDLGFTPIGRVVSGMDRVYRLHGGYGELRPRGNGPDFGCVVSHGNTYLERRFPDLDLIRRAVIATPETAPQRTP